MIRSIDQAAVVDMIHPGQGIGDIRAAGLEYLTAGYVVGDIHDMAKGKESREYYEKKREIIEHTISSTLPEAGIRVPLLKGPQLSFIAKKTSDNQRFEEESAKAVELAVRAEIPAVLIMPLFAGIAPEDIWEVNRAFYLRMAEGCRDSDVQILMPNYPRFLNGHYIRGIFTDERRTADFLDELNGVCGGQRFGFALDAGYASLCGKDMYDMVIALGDRIRAVILSDNDGHGPERGLPRLIGGPTDWRSLIRGLRAIGFDGILSLNLADTLNGIPAFYRNTIYPMAKATLDYVVWQLEMERKVCSYENVVLFGAGNMCRNYMLWFGETKRPLFTCDNNSRMWGQEFEGLIVHDPRDIRDPRCVPDPEHTGVFVCNMYYRQIERQLREMGVKNIEFFNDEFMPTSYFDRYDSIKRGIAGK